MDVWGLPGGGVINGKQIIEFLRGLGVEEPIETLQKNDMQRLLPIWLVAARFGWKFGPNS